VDGLVLGSIEFHFGSEMEKSSSLGSFLPSLGR
jgi:hypothetical protein